MLPPANCAQVDTFYLIKRANLFITRLVLFTLRVYAFTACINSAMPLIKCDIDHLSTFDFLEKKKTPFCLHLNYSYIFLNLV